MTQNLAKKQNNHSFFFYKSNCNFHISWIEILKNHIDCIIYLVHLFLGSGILYNSVCSVTISVCLSVSWQKKTCSFDVNFLGSQIPRDYVCPYVIKFLYECHKVRVVKIHWFSDPITIVLILFCSHIIPIPNLYVTVSVCQNILVDRFIESPILSWLYWFLLK